MIFYPIGYWGLPIKRWVLGSIYDCSILQPLGLFGWQVSRREGLVCNGSRTAQLQAGGVTEG